MRSSLREKRYWRRIEKVARSRTRGGPSPRLSFSGIRSPYSNAQPRLMGFNWLVPYLLRLARRFHNTQLIEEKISRETPVKWARIACIYGVYVQQVVGYFDARNARFPRLSWIFKIRVTV